MKVISEVTQGVNDGVKDLTQGMWLSSHSNDGATVDLGTQLVVELVCLYTWYVKYSYWATTGDGSSLNSASEELASELKAYYDNLDLPDEYKRDVENALMTLSTLAIKGNPNIVAFRSIWSVDRKVIGDKDVVLDTFEDDIFPDDKQAVCGETAVQEDTDDEITYAEYILAEL